MRNRKFIVIGSILLVALFVIAIVMNSINDLKILKKTNGEGQHTQPVAEPQFVNEGTLSFISATGMDTLGTINIEIADDDAQRAQGLMYRTSMKEGEGMLFIFDHSALQSFWMKNTIMSLDIIFVDENNKIVTIHKNTQPFTESPVPSYKNAKYVVEVNAGYCNRHNIKEGDRIYSTALLPVKISV